MQIFPLPKLLSLAVPLYFVTEEKSSPALSLITRPATRKKQEEVKKIRN
jgi:hypothetical protein